MRLRLRRVEALLASVRETVDPLPRSVAPRPVEADVEVEWRRFRDALALDGNYSLPPSVLAKATVEDLEDHAERLKVEVDRAEPVVRSAGGVGPPAAHLRRLNDELRRTEAAIERVFSLAYPASTNGEPVEEVYLCDYCGAKLESRHQAFALSSMCPACHDAAKGGTRESVTPLPDSIDAAVETVLKRAGIGVT